MSDTCEVAASASSAYDEWARRELGGAGFGDTRLDERLVKITAAFMAAPQASIPQAAGGWPEAKATYRFLDNDKVDPEIIYARHRDSILPRTEGEPVVLAIADTTFLDYTSHPETAGLGPLSDLVHHGLVFHPTLL
ncbi:MAG: transposase, partial [bacterium]|nr:transposase [bacterium]